MIRSFQDRETADIYEGLDTKSARRRLPIVLWRVARRKLDQLGQVRRLQQLGLPPGNGLEALYGDRLGQHSIRINDQFRVCFIWTEEGPENVEITDYH